MIRAVFLNYFLLKAALSYTLSTYRSSPWKWGTDSLFLVLLPWKQNTIAHEGHVSNLFFVMSAALFHMFMKQRHILPVVSGLPSISSSFYPVFLFWCFVFCVCFFHVASLARGCLVNQAAQLVNSLMSK